MPDQPAPTQSAGTKLTWKTISQVTAIVSLVSACLGLWWTIDQKLEESIKEQTNLIVQEMDVRTGWIAEFQKDDLFERIQVLQLEIEALEHAGTQVPERMTIHLRSMRERYEELKEIWNEQD